MEIPFYIRMQICFSGVTMKGYLVCIVLVAASLVIPMNASATGWVSATVTTDKQEYRTTETVILSITGVDSDNNPNDNWINITILDPQGSEFWSRTHQNPGASGPLVRVVPIPGNAPIGVYTIKVTDWATGVLLGAGVFTVVPSGTKILTLVPGRYTGTTTYVPGETIQANITAQPGVQCTIEVKFGNQTLRKDTITTDSTGMATYLYTLDADAPDGPSPAGERYAMMLTLCGSDYDPFDVRLYRMDMGTERTGFLPGEEIIAHYRVTRIDTGVKAPDGFAGTWILTDLTLKEVARGSFSAALGEIRATAPSTPGIYYMMGWYNSTDGKRSAGGGIAQPLTVSDMMGKIISPVDGSSVQSGGAVVVDMFVYVGTYLPLPGIDVSVTVYREGTPVPSYGKTGLVTDSAGHARYAFRVDPAEKDGTTLKIEARATKGTTSVTDVHQVRVVTKGGSTFLVWVESEKSEYFSGETVKFTVRGSVDSNPGSFTYQYTIRSGSTVFTYAVTNSQMIEFRIPDNFEGGLTCDVSVYDPYGNHTGATKTVTVRFAYILVNANILNYNPGDTIIFTYSIEPEKSLTPDLFYDIRDASGVVVSEPLISTTFSFHIPDAPSDSYTATVYASFSGHIVSGSIQITRLSGYAFRVYVSTPQPYAGGYTPGQGIKLHYAITPLSSRDTLSGKYQISYSTYGENDAKQVLTSSSEGELDYVIPAGCDGSVHVSLTARIGTKTVSTVVLVPVVANPSVLDLHVMGLATLGDLLLCVVIAVVIAILFLMNLKGKIRMGRRPSPSPPVPGQVYTSPPK